MFKATKFLPSEIQRSETALQTSVMDKWQLEYIPIHSSIILNSQKVEATKMSTNGWKEGKQVW